MAGETISLEDVFTDTEREKQRSRSEEEVAQDSEEGLGFSLGHSGAVDGMEDSQPWNSYFYFKEHHVRRGFSRSASFMD